MTIISKNTTTLLIILLLAAIVYTSRADTPLYPASPHILVEPVEIESELPPGEITETYFNIANGGDETLNWFTEIEITSIPGDDERIPGNRDVAGDVLARYIVTHTYTCGMAWDGELMWAVSRQENRLFAFNRDNIRVVHDFRIHERPYGLTIVGDQFWIGSDDRVMIYNREGELVDQFVPPFLFVHDNDLYSLAYDQDSLVYINSWQEHTVFVINAFTREEVASFDILEDLNLEDFNVSHLDWVQNHRDGHLWAIIGSWDDGFFAYQLAIDEDWQVEETSHFELEREGFVGIAHDGVDMWHGGDYRGQLWYIYDDGDAECYWMSISPRAGGDLQPNQDMDVFITLDARRLTIGLWETDIHVLSDDPDNPDIEVAVMLDVIGENVNERNNVILPELIELSAYPNPFNSTTTIKYNIPYPSNVSLQVYNLSGQRITTLFNGNQIAGFHSNILTATDLPSGLYFVKLNAGGQVFTRKLMLVK